MIIHGINDQTVPFEQSEELYDKLIENGCDADLIALEGADHADLQFSRMNCGKDNRFF